MENERDDAIADLRKLTTERDTLRERLKIATETQLADRARLEQRAEDLEIALKTVSSQKKSNSFSLIPPFPKAEIINLNIPVVNRKGLTIGLESLTGV